MDECRTHRSTDDRHCFNEATRRRFTEIWTRLPRRYLETTVPVLPLPSSYGCFPRQYVRRRRPRRPARARNPSTAASFPVIFRRPVSGDDTGVSALLFRLPPFVHSASMFAKTGAASSSKTSSTEIRYGFAKLSESASHTTRTEGRTNRRTDGRTNGRTDGRTDGRTYGRTDGQMDERAGR